MWSIRKKKLRYLLLREKLTRTMPVVMCLHKLYISFNIYKEKGVMGKKKLAKHFAV